MALNVGWLYETLLGTGGTGSVFKIFAQFRILNKTNHYIYGKFIRDFKVVK